MKQKKFIVLVAVVLVLVMSITALTACASTKFKNAYNGYSYRMGPSDLPTSWNYHTYQSNSSTYVLDYSSDSLYTFDYKDENCDSFTIVPSMAADFPTDITATVAADPDKAALWNLSSGLYPAEIDDDNGEYIVMADVVADFDDDGKGSVSLDDIYDAYDPFYDQYLDAGIIARISVGDEELPVVNRVYSIPLKHNLKFDNGDPITAHTFVDSLKLLLQPDANNFRADNVYKSGDLKIQNAEEYFKQGKVTYEDLITNGADHGTGIYTGWDKDAENYGLSDEMLDALHFVCSTSSYAGATIKKYYAEYDVDYMMAYYAYSANNRLPRKKLQEAFKAMDNMSLKDIIESDVEIEYTYTDDNDTPADKSDDVEVEATFTYKEALDALIYTWCNYAEPSKQIQDEEFTFFGVEYVWPEMDFADVGFYAADDYTLVVVLKNAMEDNFYLRYELCTSFFLVHPGKYQECISYDTGVYTNSYGTSVDKYIGYGPYKLTQYVADSTIILEKNPLWHGFDPEDASYLEGAYQTDRVVYTKVKENSTRLEMFLKGELDSYGLQPEDMADYISSDYVVYTDSESTWYLAMNPQEENLQKVQATADPVTAGNTVVKTVLCLDDFRKALSYSIDREQFNLVLSPTSGVAKALLSAMIIYDPEEGLSYRSTTEAKDAILSFWGLSDQWGEGKKYATRDDAIASITGYDPEGAKALFNNAYAQAVEAGYITDAMGDAWEVQIVIGRPSEAKYYSDGYDFLKANWTKAVEGTSFEGHLSFVQSQVLGSTSFGSYLRNGSVDILFGVGYGGSMFNPYSMIGCFTDGGNLQYDAFTNMKDVYLDVTYDFGAGVKTYRASLAAWVNDCLSGNKIVISEIGEDGEPTGATRNVSAGSSDPSGRRLAILAAAEEKIMTLSNIFPLQTDASASLHCMRINYKTEEYVLGMGFGGVKYITYNLTDKEFLTQAYKQKGHKLNYK